jgi:hypothetical protein
VPAASPARIPGARRTELPRYIEPCDPTLREQAPRGSDWVYEIKADGYRAQIHARGSEVTVYSRRGLDWTAQFAAIADAAKRVEAHDFILDGEAVVYGATGRPDFQGVRHSDRLRHRVRILAAVLQRLEGQARAVPARVLRPLLGRHLLPCSVILTGPLPDRPPAAAASLASSYGSAPNTKSWAICCCSLASTAHTCWSAVPSLNASRAVVSQNGPQGRPPSTGSIMYPCCTSLFKPDISWVTLSAIMPPP